MFAHDSRGGASNMAISSASNSRLPAVPRPRSRHRRYTEQEWDAKRSIVIRFYLQPGVTLEKTMSIMANEHNFHPTKQMYKKKLRKWGIRKNIKASEKENQINFWMQHGERVELTHDNAGLPIVHHKLRRHRRDQRYQARCTERKHQIVTKDRRDTGRLNRQKHTNFELSIGTVVRLPEFDHVNFELFYCVKEYAEWTSDVDMSSIYFSDHRNIVTAYLPWKYSADPNPSLYGILSNAVRYARLKQHSKARSEFVALGQKLCRELQKPSLYSLFSLFTCRIGRASLEAPEHHRAFWRLVMVGTEERHGRNNPLFRIMQILQHPQFTPKINLEHALALDELVLSQIKLFPAIRLRRGQLWRKARTFKHRVLYSISDDAYQIRQLVEESRTICSPHDPLALGCMNVLALALVKQGKKEEAMTMLESTLDELSMMSTIPSKIRICHYVERTLARVCKKARDFDKAETHFRAALDTSIQEFGPQDSLTLQMFAGLLEVLMSLQAIDKLLQLKWQYPEICREYEVPEEYEWLLKS